MLLHYWTNFEFWTGIWVLHQGVYDNSAWPSSPIASPCHLHQFPFWSWGNIWFDHLGARASCCCGFWHLPPSSGKILCGIYSIQSSWMDLTNSYDKRIDHDSSVSLAINGLSLQTEEVWWSWSGTFSSFASCRGAEVVAQAICNRSSFSHLIFCSFSSASAFFCANDRRVLLHHLFHSNWRGLHQAIYLITNFCMKSLWPPKGCSKCINNLDFGSVSRTFVTTFPANLFMIPPPIHPIHWLKSWECQVIINRYILMLLTQQWSVRVQYRYSVSF